MFLSYFTLNGLTHHGQNCGIWVAGEFVFGCIVIVSNMKVLISSYLISWFQLFLIIGSTLFYVMCYVIISDSITISNEFGSFYMLMSLP